MKLIIIDSISVLLSFPLEIPAFVGSYIFHSRSFIFSPSEIHGSCILGKPSTWVHHLYLNFLLKAKPFFLNYFLHSLPQTQRGSNTRKQKTNAIYAMIIPSKFQRCTSTSWQREEKMHKYKLKFSNLCLIALFGKVLNIYYTKNNQLMINKLISNILVKRKEVINSTKINYCFLISIAWRKPFNHKPFLLFFYYI